MARPKALNGPFLCFTLVWPVVNVVILGMLTSGAIPHSMIQPDIAVVWLATISVVLAIFTLGVYLFALRDSVSAWMAVFAVLLLLGMACFTGFAFLHSMGAI